MLGEQIQRLRLQQGLYLAQLAEWVGVDEMTIINWEKDRTMPQGGGWCGWRRRSEWIVIRDGVRCIP
jgi:hypothetical protein